MDTIEGAISASLDAELDRNCIVAVPPTPPGSFSTPKVVGAEWVRGAAGDIIGRGKNIVRNVRRRSSLAQGRFVVGEEGDDEVCFEEGVEVLSLDDVDGAVELERSESGESEGSGHVKMSCDDGSVMDGFGHWEG